MNEQGVLTYFGVHRSLEPPGALPQQAEKLDAISPLRPDEVAVSVELLNVDSASWRQIRERCGDDAGSMADYIAEVVSARGKLHNPVTGSGGMLIGTVAELGSHRTEPQIGERIATLVSLTLTPLVLDEISHLDPASEQVAVKGRAILFGGSIYARVPPDLPEEVALGVLDVCGAPAWMSKLAQPGSHVVVIGAGGKSGVLACAQAMRSVGPEGRVLGLCWPEETVATAERTGAEVRAVDGTDPMAVAEQVADAFGGRGADLVFVCTNVPGCEGGAIACCDDGGEVVFFSMATSFSAAALIAEGLGKACRLTIGNGYVPGHAELALDLVRNDRGLMEVFAR